MSRDAAALRRIVMGTLMPGFEGTTVPSWIHEAYAAGLASVCLYGANVAGPQALSSLCSALRQERADVVIAIDEEGGDVTRLSYPGASWEPGNAVLGRLDDEGLTRDSASRIGRELAGLGVNLNLAPVVDINSAAQNPVIGPRSFGATAELVDRHAVAWVDGLQAQGVAACAKHFPGHGDTVIDSHLALPRVTATAETLATRELEPFRAVVRAGVACVMTSHIVVDALDPDRPATFSQRVLQGVLREELGFDGVIVSDALDMVGASGELGVPEATAQALTAGCDLICLGSETTPALLAEVADTVVGAIGSGRLPEGRVRDAAERVRHLAASWPGRPGEHGESDVAPSAPLERAFEISDQARAWLASTAVPCIVQIETPANLAVGSVVWGPSALGATTDPAHVPVAAKVAVVGRALVPDHEVWRMAARLRAEGHEVVVVECGWPRGGADIVTFGGSAAVAAALTTLLGVTR